MSNRRRGATAARAGVLAAVAAAAIGCGSGSALAGDAKPQTHGLPHLAAGAPVAVETVFFGDPRRAPVRLVRGLQRPAPPPVPSQSTEIVSFGNGTAERVTVVRGGAAIPASLAGRMNPAAPTRIEKVSFADPRLPPVTVMRGIASGDAFAVDLFGPANGGELDRIAFAVDGVESRHGADFRMWRPEPNGPQGPMQVSAAAALDVGGGDRFDLRQNRLLGRAYLAQMFSRYGNWADAVAAYNWGPGAMDQWIAGGRSADRLPPGVAWYVNRVLRDALIARIAAGL
jgi:hypothetical protein